MQFSAGSRIEISRHIARNDHAQPSGQKVDRRPIGLRHMPGKRKTVSVGPSQQEIVLKVASRPASQAHRGWVAEWFKAPVLKTGVGGTLPWVQIPPHPPT
jgi:hypothetical protein